jgi:hypothetical protein
VQNALSQVSVQRVFYGNELKQINSSENFLNQAKVNLSAQEFSGWRGSRKRTHGDEPRLELAAPTGFPHVTSGTLIAGRDGNS